MGKIIVLIIVAIVFYFVFHNESREKNTQTSNEVDFEIVRLVDIAVNKIAHRYPGEISVYACTNHYYISFEEFFKEWSDFFKAVIEETSVGMWSYEQLLKYYNLTEDEAELLRSAGHIDNYKSWRIEVKKNISMATIAKIKSIAESNHEQVNIWIGTNEDSSIFLRCKPA